MSLYTDLRDAGCELDNHESDLYVKSDPTSREIIAQYKTDHPPCLVTRIFVNQTDGTQWIEVPFMFDPWWEARRK